MNDSPKVGITRAIALISFAYSLWYIETADTIEVAVLWFLGALIALWALGRVTIIELMQIWKGK